jgi:hypothetical protein
MADPKAPSTDRERRRMRNRASSMSRVRELDPAAHRDLLRSLEPAADAEKRRRTGGQRTDLEQRRERRRVGHQASGAQRTDREQIDRIQRTRRRRPPPFEEGMVGHEEDFGPVIRDRGQSQASAEEHQRAIDRNLRRRQAGGDAYGRQSTDRERRLDRLRRRSGALVTAEERLMNRSGAQVTDEELRRSRRGR